MRNDSRQTAVRGKRTSSRATTAPLSREDAEQRGRRDRPPAPQRLRVGGPCFEDFAVGQIFDDAPAMTLTVARTHTDAAASAHGRRLVYGGYTIAVTAAQATRALPNLVTILAWRGCDHIAPVFEGDILSTTLTVEATHALGPAGRGPGLVELRSIAHAQRDASEPVAVLDWQFVGLMA